MNELNFRGTFSVTAPRSDRIDIVPCAHGEIRTRLNLRCFNPLSFSVTAHQATKNFSRCLKKRKRETIVVNSSHTFPTVQIIR